MFGWLKKKKPTTDEIIAASFFEEGRWTTQDGGWTYLDNKTGATLRRDRSYRIYINEVHQSTVLSSAFYKWLSKPSEDKRAAEKAALEKLYASS